MKQRFEIEVANDVATFRKKKKYVRPEIEVVNLDEQPKLLSASTGAGIEGVSRGSWDDEE